jgi:hypothetical protein
MKKSMFLITGLLAASVAIAQAKDKRIPPPPPQAPPPPHVEAPKFIPPPPPPAPPAPEAELPEDYKAFLQRNPNVKNLGWYKNNTVRIELESGKSEMYDLNNKTEAQKLKDKYGDLPIAPPPPPKKPAKEGRKSGGTFN